MIHRNLRASSCPPDCLFCRSSASPPSRNGLISLTFRSKFPFRLAESPLRFRPASWLRDLTIYSYEDLTKPELAAALDSHLQAHQSIFIDDARLGDYYRRLSGSPRIFSPAKNSPVKTSPTKRAPKVEGTPSADEAPKSTRKRSSRSKVESVQT